MDNFNALAALSRFVPLALAGFTVPLPAVADWSCEAKLVCIEDTDCPAPDAEELIRFSIVRQDNGQYLLPDGSGGETLQIFDPPEGNVVHFLGLEDDGSALLFSIFESGELFVASHGPVFGKPYQGLAQGDCRKVN